MPIAAVENILTKNGFEYGNQFQLQWWSEKENFLFCRLDSETTLAFAYDKKTKKVVSLIVDYTVQGVNPITNPIHLYPDTVIFTPKSYAFVFKKESAQQSVPAQTNTQTIGAPSK